MNMIAVLRIHGQVKIKKEIKETLDRLRLRRKFACVLIDEKDNVKMGMVKKVTDYVVYGPTDDKLIKDIETKRGKKDKDGKLKPFFRLHPPIGGFKKSTRISYPKGILGKNKEITKLIEKML